MTTDVKRREADRTDVAITIGEALLPLAGLMEIASELSEDKQPNEHQICWVALQDAAEHACIELDAYRHEVDFVTLPGEGDEADGSFDGEAEVNRALAAAAAIHALAMPIARRDSEPRWVDGFHLLHQLAAEVLIDEAFARARSEMEALDREYLSRAKDT
jgi:hypothetical protein